MFCLELSLWGNTSVIYRPDQKEPVPFSLKRAAKKPACSELALFARFLVGLFALGWFCFFLFFWPMTFIGSSCFSWFQITFVGLFSYIPSIVDGSGLFRNDLELVAKHKFQIFKIGPGLWSSCEIGRLFGWNECCINRNQYSFIHCVPAWILWKWSNLAQTPVHNQTQNIQTPVHKHYKKQVKSIVAPCTYVA